MLLSALLVAGWFAGADSTLLRILAINDFHGALEPRLYGWSTGRPIGGAAALKATLDSAAARCRCSVLRLDAGDEMQGTLASNLVFGRSTIEALNAIGLDAAALGNHDFDWGSDTLRARMRQAHYPWLAANVFDSVSGRRPGWVVPYRILEKGGFRVAVIGYLTPQTKTIVKAENVAGLRFGGGRAAIQDVLDAAHAQHPDLTIIVAHEGAFCDSLPCRGEIIDLARELDSTLVQFIVSGHTHSLVQTVVNGIPIVQARANGTAYGIADLIQRSDGSRSWEVKVETVWADQVTPDAGTAAIVARYRPEVEQLSKRVVAVLRDSLLTPRGREFPLGNLIADAQRAAAPGTDVALMNNGGIRRDLYPGPLSYNDLFELQPFGNSLLRVRLTGAALKDVLEHALAGGRPDGHVSGLTVRYDSRRPVGDRVLELRGADGSPVRPERSYSLVVSDFLQGGGGGFAMLRLLPVERTGRTDLDALIEYLERLPQPIVAPAGERFHDIAK
ncbi:MAG TPA: 5'-nucleotidase C-terminal domain-containing protein [Gemmatimonadales bacterium]|nr:5'-nucleotidase C-terminal domain-containing protein [Gemmatimonadales bacterium]